jgi:hypothetical protein
MTNERRPVSGADEVSIESGELRVDAAPLNYQPAKSDMGRHILSASALAAAVAAVALPLVNVTEVKAQTTVSCGSDSYGGYDVGDISDCADCAYAATPSDCYVQDSSGGVHWGTASDHTDVGDAPGGDTGGDGGGCGGCGGCGGGDYGY